MKAMLFVLVLAACAGMCSGCSTTKLATCAVLCALQGSPSPAFIDGSN